MKISPCPVRAHLLHATIHKGDFLLVIFDVLDAFLDDYVNGINQVAMRRVFKVLMRIAAATGCAILAIHHPNKGQGTGTDKVSGSRAYSAACRSVLVTGKHPHEPDQLVLADLKGNYRKDKDMPGITYGFEGRGSVARIGWGEPCEVNGAEIFGERNPARKPSKRRQAMAFLASFLQSGKRLSKDVYAAAANQDLDEHTLKNAAGQLAVDRSEKTDTFPAEAYWKLPPYPPLP